MKQHYIDEKTGISYTLQGDYYLPDLVLPAEKENRSVGILGQRHLRYLKQHRKVFYTNLLTSGKLRSYTVLRTRSFSLNTGFSTERRIKSSFAVSKYTLQMVYSPYSSGCTCAPIAEHMASYCDADSKYFFQPLEHGPNRLSHTHAPFFFLYCKRRFFRFYVENVLCI